MRGSLLNLAERQALSEPIPKREATYTEIPKSAIVQQERRITSILRTYFPTIARAVSGSHIESHLGPPQEVVNVAQEDEWHSRGMQIYEDIVTEARSDQIGQYVCINPDTREYIIGMNSKDAYDKFVSRAGNAKAFGMVIGARPHDLSGATL